jgi:hypothetical protein
MNNIWRRFNDMRVEIVEESEVFQNANGGLGQRTAFWIVYIDLNQLNDAKSLDIHTLNSSDSY